MFIWLVLIVLTVALDQLSKYLVILHLKPVGSVPIIEDVLHLTYVENTGAAFGSLKDARWVFMIVSSVAIVAILCYMVWRTYIKKNPLPWVEALALSLIVGGGIGNMIDRTLLGYVVDMIDFCLIDFAVFNVADSFVCIGAGLMMLHLIVAMLKEGKEPAKELPEEIDDGFAAALNEPSDARPGFDGDEEDALYEAYAPETAVEAAESAVENTDADPAAESAVENTDADPAAESADTAAIEDKNHE